MTSAPSSNPSQEPEEVQPTELSETRCQHEERSDIGLSLEELMARYLEGQETAFEMLYRQLTPRLFGYLLRLTRHRERAEDLVQITFAKIHRARASYLLDAPVLPWALAIARRSFLDECRRAKVRPEDLSRDGELPEPGARAPERDADLAEALEFALQRIPAQYAEAIQLTKITELSIAEAATVLNSTKAAVKLRVHRGYALLRKELEDYGRHI
ncbi:MAG: RNA polymerase sigma factor [Polyangiaceae bacterium]|nr:RNA polymerase sigma factor [Polyangiaceae bacterium]